MDTGTEPSRARSTLALVDASRPRLAATAHPKRGSAPRHERAIRDGSAPSLVTGLAARGLCHSFLQHGQLQMDLTPKNDNAALPADGRRAAPGFMAMGNARLCGAVIVELAGRPLFRPAISRTDVLASSGDAA